MELKLKLSPKIGIAMVRQAIQRKAFRNSRRKLRSSVKPLKSRKGFKHKRYQRPVSKRLSE
jgi:hypothetical protein